VSHSAVCDDCLFMEHFVDLTTQHRQQVDIGDEAWSMAAGLKPRPHELSIEAWADEAGRDAESDEYSQSWTISIRGSSRLPFD
jgi:hypothetical protein